MLSKCNSRSPLVFSGVSGKSGLQILPTLEFKNNFPRLIYGRNIRNWRCGMNCKKLVVSWVLEHWLTRDTWQHYWRERVAFLEQRIILLLSSKFYEFILAVMLSCVLRKMGLQILKYLYTSTLKWTFHLILCKNISD